MNVFCQRVELYLIFIFFSQQLFSSPESSQIDSLKKILHSSQNDTSRVTVLNALAKEYGSQEKADSAISYCNEAIGLSQQLVYKSGLAEAYSEKGTVENGQGNYLQAIKDFEAALKVYKELGDKKNAANAFNLVANAYHEQGDYPDALKNQFDALKIREEIGDEKGIAWSYNNIGTIYRIQGDYKAALENYFASLKLLTKFDDKKMIAIAYNNIGNVYSLQGKHTDALASYFSSLKIRQQTGDKQDILASYLNIGDAFCDIYEKDSVSKEVRVEIAANEFRTIPRKNWLDTAMRMMNRANTINGELKNKYFTIFGLSGMGRINFLKKNYAESIRLYTKAYTIAEEMKELDLQKEIAKYLADNYDGLKDFNNGRKWYMKYVAHKDTLDSQLKSDELIRTRMKYEFEKKEGEAKAVQEKKDALAKMELDRQKRMRTIFQGGFAVVLLFAGIFLYQRVNIKKEKARSDNLLLNILPSEIASELKETGASETKSYNTVTVMFTDFVDFTKISEKISPEELVKEIHTCFSAFDHILQKHKIEKIKTIGDAYLCAGGLPVPDPDHAIHVVNAAIEIMNYIQERKKIKEANNELPFQLRIGIHSGPVVAGIVGVKKYAYDIWGDTVNIAARMEQNSMPGKINISSKTYELVKDQFDCTYRGKIEAKNKGEIDMYFVNWSFL